MTRSSAEGFWRLFASHLNDVLLSWDLWVAAVLGYAVIWLEPTAQTVVAFASAAAGVASAIIGIVLAALAIVTAFMDQRYVAVLSQAGIGMSTEVFSFRYPAAIAVVSLVLSGAIILVQDESWFCAALPWLLSAAVFFFAYTLFITLNLVASIGGHMMNRSLQLEEPEE